MMRTHLGSIGKERRLLVVELDGFGVKIDGSRKVAGGEGLVALVLEFDSFSFSRHGEGGWDRKKPDVRLLGTEPLRGVSGSPAVSTAPA